MFVWADGKVNPCDYDYKSLLSSGMQKPINKRNMEFKRLQLFEKPTFKFTKKNIEPCKRCLN